MARPPGPGTDLREPGRPASSSAASRPGVQGNRIGTDVTGTQSLGKGTGVFLTSGFERRDRWDRRAAAGNLISGNLGDGIAGRAEGVQIQGNRIGTDVTGTDALANGGNGISFFFAENARHRRRIGGCP